MTHRQKALLLTLAGHFAWLETAYPRLASEPLTRRAKRQVQRKLRSARVTTGRGLTRAA